MKKVVFFEHPADIEFEAYGKTLEEVFENVAKVVLGTITNVAKVDSKIRKEIEISSEDLPSLLYDFIEQILIFHDAENLVFKEVKVKKIERVNGRYFLEAELKGEEYSPEKHESGTVIKAITYHEMQIGKKRLNKEELYFAHVVLDI